MPADKYIIGSRVAVAGEPYRFAKTPADAVANYGAAELLGHREAEARRPFCGRLTRIQRLQQKPLPGHPGSAGHGAEFGPFPEALHAALGRPQPARRSGREPLPPAGTTGGDDLASALPAHPSAETVPSLAHELARLIGAFHRKSVSAGFCRVGLIRSRPNRVKRTQAACQRLLSSAVTSFTNRHHDATYALAHREGSSEVAMTEELKPDICVIGGGPAGIRLAVAAANAAVPVVLIEKGTLGGANLADGGVPSKALIAAASEYETLRRGPGFGVSGAPLTVDFARLRDHIAS